jgi:hypothetical protein
MRAALDVSDIDFDMDEYAAAHLLAPTRERCRKWGLESLYRQKVKARSRQLLINAMRVLQANRDAVKLERGRPMISCDEMAMLQVYMRQVGACIAWSNSDFEVLVKAGIIAAAPCPNTLGNWRNFEGMQARGDPLLGGLVALHNVILLPMRRSFKDVIVDSTGLSINGNPNWIDCEKGTKSIRSGTEWAKLHVAICKATKLVPAFRLTEHVGKFTGDCSNLIPVLKDILALRIRPRSVTADKINSTDEIYAFIMKIPADPIIPMEWNFKAKTKILTPVMYAEWLQDRYENRRPEFEALVGPRSIVESTIESIKGKNDERLWARKTDQRLIEVYCKIIAHNIRRLVWSEIVDMHPPINFGAHADEVRSILYPPPKAA